MKSTKRKINSMLSAALIILGVAAIICICMVLIADIEEPISPERLSILSRNAMKEYPYVMFTMDAQYQENDKTVVQEHVITSSTVDPYKSYMYRSDVEAIYECWNSPNSEGGRFDLYIYDSEHECWVSYATDEEPLTVDIWSFADNFNEFSMLEDTYKWGDDDCYVIQKISSNSLYKAIYEEVYIRCSDYLPMGINVYSMSDPNDVTNDADVTVDEDGNVLDSENEVNKSDSYYEQTTVYTFTFSNESLALFEMPEEYFTAEEYMNSIASREGDVSDGTSNN